MFTFKCILVYDNNIQVENDLADSQVMVSETIRWISNGPNKNVMKYDTYFVNGYKFMTKNRDTKNCQNSGVSIVVRDMHISRKQETTYTDTPYYGILKSIWILDYHYKQIPVFLCDWAENKKGVITDDFGYTLVDMKKMGLTNDPFILASQAQQVFYVSDQAKKNWSIVFTSPSKKYRHVYEENVGDDDDDEEFSTVVSASNEFVLPKVDKLDLQHESRDDYYRTDIGGIVLRPVCHK